MRTGEDLEVRGQCALCLRDEILMDSHLLPKALYRFVRAADGSPIVLNRHAAWITDKQITKHLLCAACEERFHRHGEDWTLRQIYRGERRFRLLDVLNRCTPVAENSQIAVYALSDLPDILIDDLSYFAVSVFWRSSATDWQIGDHKLPRPTFGPKYMAAFSEYLLGNAGFPSDVSLLIEVCDGPTTAANMLIFPIGTVAAGYDRYDFMVPGVLFRLFVGENIPVELRSCCIVTGDHPVVSRRNYEQLIYSRLALLSETARISKRLKDEMSGPPFRM